MRLYLVFALLFFTSAIRSDVKANTNNSKSIIDSVKKELYLDVEGAKIIALSGYDIFKAENVPDEDILAQFENLLGVIYRRLNKLDSALIFHEKSLKRYQNLKDPKGIAYNFSNLSTVFSEKKDTLNARRYLLQSIHFFNEIKDFRSAKISYINLGSCYFETNDFGSALFYYNLAEQITIKPEEDPRTLLLLYSNKSRLYHFLRDKVNCKKYLEKGKVELEKAPDTRIQLTLWLDEAYVLLEEGNVKKAETLLDLVKDQAIEFKFFKIAMEASQQLISFYSMNNRFEDATEEYADLLVIKDSFNNVYQNTINKDLLRNIDEIKENFALTTLKLEKENIRLKNKRQNAVIAFICLILLFALYSIWQQTNKLKRISTLNTQLKESEAKLMLKTKDFEKLNHALETTILERTKKLEEKNKQLRDYAFYNAHKLRSPVANIKGLYQLIKLSNSAKEKEELTCLLYQSAEELDTVVHELQKIVDE
ncbi:MAG: hypothetical protein ACXITV_13330 [Luteibaculaceae bacterium]